MNEAEYRALLSEHFLPMLAGTGLAGTVPSTPRHSLCAFADPCRLLLKPTTNTNYRVEAVRSQGFTVVEKKLCDIFSEELLAVAGMLGVYKSEIMAALPRRVLSRLLARRDAQTTLEVLVRHLESLAGQTYEGHPIVAAVGVTGGVGNGAVTMGELWNEDFARVLSNGYDSMYLCGADGRIFNMALMPLGGQSPSFAPNRLGPIASWTARANRIAAVLNRNGEVLVFSQGILQFAKRRGAWKYYPHEAMVTRMGRRATPRLRKAIYETALDVSFARTGGCIALVRSDAIPRVGKILHADDLLTSGQNTRARLLNRVVRHPFGGLDRRIRQELLAMDGATVLGHDGTIIASGAIVKVRGGSQGGGRRAAAVALSKYGFALKISEDGPITGFQGGGQTPVLAT